MSTNLPNLSTWHRVPLRATIPAGTPYAYAYEDVLDLTDGMPTRPRRAMSALETLRVTLNSIPRHAMGGKRARALNSIGLGCTAEPRRAR